MTRYRLVRPSYLNLSWDEAKHPRGKGGVFIDVADIEPGHTIRATGYGRKNRVTMVVKRVDPPGKYSRMVVGHTTVGKGTRYERQRIAVLMLDHDAKVEKL